MAGMRREFAAMLDDVAAEEARAYEEYRARVEARAGRAGNCAWAQQGSH
jgi:hypothetical protein